MRIAILTDTDSVFVEFPEHVFRPLLRTYVNLFKGDVDKALDKIEQELRQLTITK